MRSSNLFAQLVHENNRFHRRKMVFYLVGGEGAVNETAISHSVLLLSFLLGIPASLSDGKVVVPEWAGGGARVLPGGAHVPGLRPLNSRTVNQLLRHPRNLFLVRMLLCVC